MSSSSDNDMIETPEAAKMLAMHRVSVVRLCESGRIKGAEQVSGVGGRWRMPRASVAALKEASRVKRRSA